MRSSCRVLLLVRAAPFRQLACWTHRLRTTRVLHSPLLESTVAPLGLGTGWLGGAPRQPHRLMSSVVLGAGGGLATALLFGRDSGTRCAPAPAILGVEEERTIALCAHATLSAFAINTTQSSQLTQFID
eukprot:SAG11_NODE_11286_length_771_cov_0.927083_1_plen_129_part_00